MAEEKTKIIENREEVNPQALENDIETFGNLCKEMNETMEESQVKLELIKEKLEKINEDYPVKGSANNNYQYIDVKSMLLLNYIMSLQYYTLCKIEGKDLEQHEIFERLAYLRLMIEKLKPLDKKVDYQIEKLLRSAVTQNQGQAVIPNRQSKEDNLRYKPNLNNFDSKHITEKADPQAHTMDDEEAEGEESVQDLSEGDVNEESSDIDPDNINSDDIDSEELEKYTVAKQKASVKRKREEDEEKEEPQLYKAIKHNPVTLTDNSKKAQKQRERDQKRMTRVDLVRELKRDMLDLPEEVNYGVASGNKRLIEEEKADEDLEMKYFKRINYSAKELKQREKRMKKYEKSDFSGITDGFHDFQRIQEFMGKTYGEDEDGEMEKQAEKQKFLDEVRSRKRDKKGKTKFMDDEINSDEAGDDVLFKNLPKRSKKNSIEINFCLFLVL